MAKFIDREALQGRIALLLKTKFEFDHPSTPADIKTALLLGSDFSEAECLGAAMLLNTPVGDTLRFQREYRNRLLDALIVDMATIGHFGATRSTQ